MFGISIPSIFWGWQFTCLTLFEVVLNGFGDGTVGGAMQALG
jgi:hypothetical protein